MLRPHLRPAAATAPMAPAPTAPTPTVPAPAPPAATPSAATPSRLLALLGLVVALACAVVLSVAVGTRALAPTTVWQLLWHDDGSAAAGLVHDLRLPRTALAVAVGAALAVAGSLLQAVTGNPMADPGLLGLSTGASCGVVVALLAGFTTVGGQLWFALAGAGLAGAAVLALGARGGRGEATVQRQVLAGLAITAAGSAAVNGVLLARPDVLDRFRFWDVGSLAERGLDDLGPLLPFLLVGGALAAVLAPALNTLALGAETAAALGVHVGAVRVGALVAVTLLCGTATALVGPIAFVGLAVPHAVRAVTGPDRRRELVGCLLLGPVVLLLADVAGRVLVRPSELEVGIVAAALGAPVFLALLTRRRTVAA